MVFADIAQPAAGCQTIVRSPAAVDKPGCGVVIGDFHQSACVSLAFHKTFMLQKQCNGKMIRGMDWKRSSDGFGALTLTFENGTTIEPLETGEPPELQERDASADDDTFLLDAPMLEDRDADPSETDTDSEYHVNNLFTRQHSKSCKGWKPKSAALSDYTKSAGHTQIVATNVDGGKQGATVQISKARTASESISMTAGVNLEVVEASTTITFEKSTTDTKTFTFNIPAGQLGNVGFTPTVRCSTGKYLSTLCAWIKLCADKRILGTCKGSGSHGTVCTGFHQGGAIAGTYAVIAES